jgi:hypothetical protein
MAHHDFLTPAESGLATCHVTQTRSQKISWHFPFTDAEYLLALWTPPHALRQYRPGQQDASTQSTQLGSPNHIIAYNCSCFLASGATWRFFREIKSFNLNCSCLDRIFLVEPCVICLYKTGCHPDSNSEIFIYLLGQFLSHNNVTTQKGKIFCRKPPLIEHWTQERPQLKRQSSQFEFD